MKKNNKRKSRKNDRKNRMIVKRILLLVLSLAVLWVSPSFYKTIVNDSKIDFELKQQLQSLMDIFTDWTTPVDNDGEDLFVHYIDVGQGDATLIQVGNKNLLIDTGESSESEKLIGYLKDKGVSKLDNFIVTHPHTDHMGGAVSILGAFKVDNLYMTNYVHTTKAYEKLLKTIKEKKINVTRAKKGVTVDLGDKTEAVILSPDRDYEDINASSIVLHLTYGRTKFLFSGDAITATEKNILKNLSDEPDMDLQADVYKVAHHGSNTSNSKKFIDAVNPSYAVISVGKGNSYKHPHSEVMDLFQKKKLVVLRTDESGNIVFVSDGKYIKYDTEKGK